MNFFYVYVLFSKKDRKLYIGFTKNIQNRVNLHHKGHVTSTAPRRPLLLIYYEAHANKSTALRREKYFKTTSGRRTLKIVLKEILQELDYQGL